MPIVICEMDLTKLMEGNYKPKAITKIGKTPIKVVLSDKKIIEVVDNDPLLQQQLVDAGQDVIKAAAKDAAKVLMSWEKSLLNAVKNSGRSGDAEAFAYGFETDYKRLADDVGSDVEKALKAVWKKYTATNKEYKRYKWSNGFTIAFGVFGVGASIAGAVGAAGTANPIACACSIAAAMKAASKTMQTIRSLRKDAGSAYTDLHKGLEKVKTEYANFNKTQKSAKEVLASAADQLLTAQLPSLRTSEKNLKTFRKKLKGVEVNLHKVSKELNTALKKSGALVKDTKNMPKELKTKIESDVKKLEKSVGDGIGKIGDMLGQIKQGEKDADNAKATIDQLMLGVDEKIVKNAGRFLGLVSMGLDVWGGNVEGGDFRDALAIIGYSMSGAETVKDAYEDHFNK
jgi:predicted  nucleic acid-binding Zn-ribbon protein